MGDRTIDTGTARADPAKRPATIDIKPEEGPSKGKTILAVFERDGDRLKICYDMSGAARPKGFTTRSGTEELLIVYTRAK